MMEYTVIDSPAGHIVIEALNGAIERVAFTDEEWMPSGNKLLQEAEKQLQQYFAGERKAFDLPVRLHGTAFQQKAWQVLTQIPYGETITYGQQANRMGHPKACRAVGGANHKNPIAIIIPCHRVVSGNGLGGYATGTEKKRFLLELEAGIMRF